MHVFCVVVFCFDVYYNRNSPEKIMMIISIKDLPSAISSSCFASLVLGSSGVAPGSVVSGMASVSMVSSLSSLCRTKRSFSSRKGEEKGI